MLSSGIQRIGILLGQRTIFRLSSQCGGLVMLHLSTPWLGNPLIYAYGHPKFHSYTSLILLPKPHVALSIEVLRVHRVPSETMGETPLGIC